MKIKIILTVNTITSNKIKRAAKSRGHEVEILKNFNFELTDINKSLKVFEDADLVYYLSGLSQVSVSVLFQYLKKKKIKTINGYLAENLLFHEKVYEIYHANKNGIKCPKTLVGRKLKYEEIKDILGEAFILKESYGYGGSGVYMIENEEDYIRVKGELDEKEIVYQEHIPNDEDYRVHLVGGMAICGYKRLPQGNDFRANVSLGGTMEKISDKKLERRLFKLSEKISSHFKDLELPGVDLMVNKESGEIYFLEINATPGLKDVEKVTGVNVADEFVRYFEKF